ncbi:MAG: hypothetical protein ACREH5_03210 [Candidatus Omnitrophota bacterium]
MKKNWLGIPDSEAEVTRRFAAPGWILKSILVVVTIMFIVELPLIFFVLTPEQVARVMAWNGSAVMTGALAWLGVLYATFMFPTKRMQVWMVMKSEEQSSKNESTVRRIEKALDRLESESEGGKIRQEVENASRALQDIRIALVKPIGKPPLPPEAKTRGGRGVESDGPAVLGGPASPVRANGASEPVSTSASDLSQPE